MKTTAVIAMAGKPVHAGHFALIEKAAQENDTVMLFVSLNNRINDGEFPVYGADMKEIWDDHLIPILPENVVTVFEQGSPVSNAYAFIGAAADEETINIYGDPNDVAANFPEKSLKKYAPNLYASNRVVVVPVPRVSTVLVSGVQMRRYLKQGNKLDFINNLPQGTDGDTIWNKLRLRRS